MKKEVMNLNRRFTLNGKGEWYQCPWWTIRTYRPLKGIGLAVYTFRDDLRAATMLEF